jgi:hypothetical protein
MNEMAAFLDQALGPEEEVRLHGHFRLCAKCRKAVEELLTLLGQAPLEPHGCCLEEGKALVARERPASAALPLASGGVVVTGFRMHMTHMGGN